MQISSWLISLDVKLPSIDLVNAERCPVSEGDVVSEATKVPCSAHRRHALDFIIEDDLNSGIMATSAVATCLNQRVFHH